MTKENNLKLVGKGSKLYARNSLIFGLLNEYLDKCKLKVVIETIYGEKLNVLVNASVQEDFTENDVIARFKNARDVFKFLQGYYTCLKNLSK